MKLKTYLFKSIFISLLFILFASQLQAQDINCQIKIEFSQIERTDPILFKNLERALFDFVNNQKWTRDLFKENERVEINFLLTISKEIGGNRFGGNLQVQSRRPVFGTSYNSPVLNHKDENIEFNYSQFDVLNYAEGNAGENNLTALFAYYIYLALGFDYDTFGKEGGTPFLQQCLSIVNQCQNNGFPGWGSFENQNNRYWITENYLEARFKGIRNCMFEYHRQGLDQMAEKQKEGRAAITKALQKLEEVHRNLPNSINLRLFFNAKGDEIVNIFKEADAPEKTSIIDLLSRIDPAGIQKWSRINER